MTDQQNKQTLPEEPTQSGEIHSQAGEKTSQAPVESSVPEGEASACRETDTPSPQEDAFSQAGEGISQAPVESSAPEGEASACRETGAPSPREDAFSQAGEGISQEPAESPVPEMEEPVPPKAGAPSPQEGSQPPVPPGMPYPQQVPPPGPGTWGPTGTPYVQGWWGSPYGNQPAQGFPPYSQPVPAQPQPGQAWTAGVQPPVGQNKPTQPAPYQGAPGAYPPPSAWGRPPKTPRKKMSLGLKVFLWIASALAAGVILGFGAFVVVSAVTGSGPLLPGKEEAYSQELPEEDMEPSPDEEAPQEEDSLDLPDVDVVPNTQGITIQEKPEGDPLDAQEAYDKVVQSTVSIEVSQGGDEVVSTGTGIIATSDGYMITNAHVVLNSKNVLVTVTTYDGQTYDAVVVGVNRSTDLAVIKTNDYQFTPAEFGDAGQLAIGEWVLAIGNPGGSRFAGSVTRGIVSGLDRAVERYSENGMTYIQTDAAINPGNSGGPLVNMYGQVVGINSSKIITEGYEGMGFAIPVSKAKDILDQLLSGGYVQGRVRLGISGKDVSEMEATFNGTPQGFRIISIDEDSAFAGTDAQVGDIITALDGETVTQLTDLSNLLLRYKPGDQVTVTLFRFDESNFRQTIEVEITLLEDRGETQG